MTLTPEDKNLLHQRGLHLDEQGLIRCHPPLAQDTNYPLLLDPRDSLWPLIVQHHHRLHQHCSAPNLLVILREHFWVSRMRQSINSILRRCLTCRQVQKPPCNLPAPPRVHFSRVSPRRPFFFTGIDFTGAYTLAGGALRTAYIVGALRRFSARFGAPSNILSDNATTFHASNSLLKDLCDPRLTRFTRDRDISWHFITPLAPW